MCRVCGEKAATSCLTSLFLLAFHPKIRNMKAGIRAIALESILAMLLTIFKPLLCGMLARSSVLFQGMLFSV